MSERRACVRACVRVCVCVCVCARTHMHVRACTMSRHDLWLAPLSCHMAYVFLLNILNGIIDCRDRTKGSLRKGSFTGGISSVSLNSLRICRRWSDSPCFSTLWGFSRISKFSNFIEVSKNSRICRNWIFLKAPLFQKTPCSEPQIASSSDKTSSKLSSVLLVMLSAKNAYCVALRPRWSRQSAGWLQHIHDDSCCACFGFCLFFDNRKLQEIARNKNGLKRELVATDGRRLWRRQMTRKAVILEGLPAC